MAGGHPDQFEEFYKTAGMQLIAERIRQNAALVAKPKDYMDGVGGGGRSEGITPSPTFGPRPL